MNPGLKSMLRAVTRLIRLDRAGRFLAVGWMAGGCCGVALRAQTPTPAGPAGGTVTADQFIKELSQPMPTGRTRGMSVHPAPQVSVQILFKTGSAEVTGEAAQEQLRQAGEALRSDALSAFRFEIEGHTDNVGNPERNNLLSRRRAEAIVAFLHARYGIAAERMKAAGRGDSDPVESNDTAEGRARNRRVVFKRLE